MAILPIFIPHAGCPHQCVFCNQQKISGQHSAAVDGAREQIARWRQWLRPDPANEAAFYGGSFTGLNLDLQRELLALTDALLAEGFIGSVRLSTRPDYIDATVLDLLRAHGVKLVELGVQSLDDAVLAAAERGHSAAQVEEAVKLLRKYGFGVGLQLMVGMPQQDFPSVKATVRKVIALRPDVARIYPLLVIKDTPLAAQYSCGEFTPLTLEEAVEQSAYVYRELTQAGIKVIRIGLQPDEELCSPGNIIAGPFHPSMGELVQSRVLRDDVTQRLTQIVQQTEGVGTLTEHTEHGVLKAAAQQREIVLHCSLQEESKLRGIKNCNLAYWRDVFPNLHIKIEHNLSAGMGVTIHPAE